MIGKHGSCARYAALIRAAERAEKWRGYLTKDSEMRSVDSP
jgi:hypothetical protein